jgi:hypothetical protein
MNQFGESAKGLSQNSLGIIALFIVLVYGIASLVLAFGNGLDAASRTPLVWFMVLFPPLVLIVFAWLVSQHYEKLYSPGDYGDREFMTSVIALKSERNKISPELAGQILKNMDPTAHNVNELTPVDDTDPTVAEGAVDEAPTSPAEESSELVSVLAAMSSVREE